MDNKKKTILLVNSYRDSSGKYIIDAKKRGIESVILLKPKQKLTFKTDAKIIREKPTYQETLALVKTYHPFAVFSGDEAELEMTMRLQRDLHLTMVNDYRDLNTLTRKDDMHKALKKAGLRYIRGEIAHSVKDAVNIFRKLKAKEVIMKAPRACGSDSLSYCKNEKEIIKSANKFFRSGAHLTINKSTSDLLIQERIIGDEYFVNTASCNGHHKILQIWKYKVIVKNNCCTFINAEVVEKVDKKIANLINYTKKVLDAVHVKNGPVHTELMMDEKGPVLMEVNCRISGCALNIEYDDAITGQHDTDHVLNAILFPKEFIKHINDPYRVYQSGCLEFLNSPRRMIVKSRPIFAIFKRLKSFHDHNLTLKKTKKLKGGFSFMKRYGIVHLAHHNKKIVKDESKLIEYITNHYFYLFMQDVDAKNEDIPPRLNKGATLDIELPNIIKTGLTIVLSDNKENHIPYATVTDLKNVKNELNNFTFGVINFKQSLDHLLREDLIENTLTFMEKIRSGGKIYISARSINLFPYGINGIKIMLKLTDFTIVSNKKDYLIAVKNS